MAQGVLDVIAEDPEVEHVAQDVQPAAVDEGCCEDGPGLVEPRWVVQPVDEVAGYDTVIEEEAVDIVLGERQLVDEDGEVSGDECDIDEREGSRPDGVGDADNRA